MKLHFLSRKGNSVREKAIFYHQIFYLSSKKPQKLQCMYIKRTVTLLEVFLFTLKDSGKIILEHNSEEQRHGKFDMSWVLEILPISKLKNNFVKTQAHVLCFSY